MKNDHQLAHDGQTPAAVKLKARLCELTEVLQRRCKHALDMPRYNPLGARVRVLGRHVGKLPTTNLIRAYSATWGLEVQAVNGVRSVHLARPDVLPEEVVEICPISRHKPLLGVLRRNLGAIGAHAIWIKAPLPEVLVPLGYGCVYRTSQLPNIRPELKGDELWWIAAARIAEGEELLAPECWPEACAKGSGCGSSQTARPQPTCPADVDRGDNLACSDGSVQGAAGAHPAPRPDPLQLGELMGGIRFAASPVHGLGVFGRRAFRVGDLVDVCPALHLPDNGMMLVRDYAMRFGSETDADVVLPLGLGAVFNHRATPQVEWFYDIDMDTVVYVATQQTEIGEELFINYGQNYFPARGLDSSS